MLRKEIKAALDDINAWWNAASHQTSPPFAFRCRHHFRPPMVLA